MTDDVAIEAIAEQCVVTDRAPGTARDIGPRLETLAAAVATAGLTTSGPPLARFYTWDPVAGGDFDVCLALLPAPNGALPDEVGGHPVEVIPFHHALVIRHAGTYDGLATAYAALDDTLAALGYALAGPPYEVYVRGPRDGAAPAQFVTEVRYPCAR
jgi:hypothetical protein